MREVQLLMTMQHQEVRLTSDLEFVSKLVEIEDRFIVETRIGAKNDVARLLARISNVADRQNRVRKTNFGS